MQLVKQLAPSYLKRDQLIKYVSTYLIFVWLAGQNSPLNFFMRLVSSQRAELGQTNTEKPEFKLYCLHCSQAG